MQARAERAPSLPRKQEAPAETAPTRLRPVEPVETGEEKELSIGEYPAAIAAAEDSLLDKHAKLAAVKNLDNLDIPQRDIIYGPSGPIGKEYAKLAELQSKWQTMVADADKANTRLKQWGEGQLTPQQQEVLAAKQAADAAAAAARAEANKQQYSGAPGGNPVLQREQKLRAVTGPAEAVARKFRERAQEEAARQARAGGQAAAAK